jgi:hypothetical protein
MTDDDRLRLIALDEEDLAILSAHVQDAVLKVGEVDWSRGEKRVVIPINRFAWEQEGKGRRREHQRRRSALHFARVETVRSQGFDRNAKDQVLELLAIRFQSTDAPSGQVLLDFAGGATISLQVEVLEAQLTDLGPAWSTSLVPRHNLA